MAKAASNRSRKPAKKIEAEATGENVAAEETSEETPAEEAGTPEVPEPKDLAETETEEVAASEPDQAEDQVPAPEAQKPDGPRKLTGQEAELAAQIFCQLVTTPMAVGKDPSWLAEAAIQSATAFGQAIQGRTT